MNVDLQASKETGALKEAKDKLEKSVEELTWRLQLEKRLRVLIVFFAYHVVFYLFCCLAMRSYASYNCCSQTEKEEEKAKEAAKQQNAMQELKTKLEEANALAIKEREAAKKAIEEAPAVVKETEVVVQDTEKIESLSAEIEFLKVYEIIPITESLI